MTKPRAFVRSLSTLLLSASLATLLGCSGKSSAPPASAVPSLPLGPEIPAGSVPPSQEKFVSGPLSSTLRVANANDQIYLEVESVLSPTEFANLRTSAGIGAALAETKATLKTLGAISTAENSEVGYLKFWLPYQRDMLGALKTVSFSHELYFSPSHYDFNSLKQAKAFTAANLGFAVKASASDPTTDAYSGLSVIHAPDFVKAAEAAIGGGAKVDGSGSRLGIADTGITYNHPTFTDATGKISRVAYMGDFTREGRVYFNPAGAFTLNPPKDPTDKSSDFLLSAQYLETITLPILPSPIDFKEVKDLPIKVSAALKADLTNADLKAFLGYLNEKVFQGGENAVDINANGKLDDRIPMILITDAAHPEKNRVYADFDGQASPTSTIDFSKSEPLADFNLSKATTAVFAEKIGFAIKSDHLAPPGSDKPVPVISASIVGYDAGNHGSHVAGIAAGRKTISNDSDTTLARGVAPAAQILSDRVCANNGGCNPMEAILDLALNAGADVINMSLGSVSPFNDGYGTEETLINRLSSVKNVLFVISAGNSGPGRQTVGSPSVASKAISVAATATRAMIQRQYEWPGAGASTAGATDDFVLYFSSRGPTAAGGFAPNLAAPGTELSSVQLNSAPGGHAGLDVYWGTSMSAPVVSGSYALFLDAVRKYNAKHPTTLLPTDVATLRSVLLSSARPFGQDQYTWIDEGNGMIDLSAAWNKILKLRTEVLNTGVADAKGIPVALDYQVVTSIVSPNGTAYDGSRMESNDDGTTLIPAFGSGLYFDTRDGTEMKKAFISRSLTEKDAASPQAGDLTVKLVTSVETFTLRSDFGRDDAWAKAGVESNVDCQASKTSDITVLGRGVQISRTADGKGQIDNYSGSDINICIDRTKLALLAPGDHGGLVYGYRTVGGKTSTLPSFIIPIYVTIPHQTLAAGTAYSVTGTVRGFQVARNYVMIPPATSVLQITLEVPENKPGVACASVLLEMLEGGNTKTPAEADTALRAYNCTGQGAPSATQRKIVLTRTNPTPGIWDLHLLGLYNVALSNYTLRVDYAVGQASVAKIAGDESALDGGFDWSLKENSFPVVPSPTKSTFKLSALYHRENSQVKKGDQTVVGGPLGQLRKYDASVKAVQIDTGGSTGNDIDLEILECPGSLASATDLSTCNLVAQSGGPTDVESAIFAPKPEMAYAVRVDGYAIKDEGKFFADESIVTKSELGSLAISGSAPTFHAAYSFGADATAASALLKAPLYLSKDYSVRGSVTLKTEDGTSLVSVPVLISK
jgi:hypothetical protein